MNDRHPADTLPPPAATAASNAPTSSATRGPWSQHFARSADAATPPHDHGDPATYRFDAYLRGRGEDWLASDELLQRWLGRRPATAGSLELVQRFGRQVATHYDALAHVVELREHLPAISEADPFNRHTCGVVLPAETWRMLAEVHGSGIWKAEMNERARYAIAYLLSQNGEAGVVCSMACTDGLQRALRRFGDDAHSAQVLVELERATPQAWVHGAQFVTEIQGGSDAASNQLRADDADDGLYRLSGDKWFCSNLTADYWMLTARMPHGPRDHRGIALFCVPRRWQGTDNGWQIIRLKDKVGTRALPTAEMRFDCALGWPVGPLDAGLRNVVGVVLTTSRVYNTLASAAGRRRAVREARAYAEFRHAFGRPLGDHPLLAASLSRLEQRADEAQAGALSVVDVWLDALSTPDDKGAKLWARVLISIAKAVSARQAVGEIYEAMMVLGGNGIEEQFSALPRLWRDAAIMETWEGPYTLLLMQALGDLAKYGVAGHEEALLRRGLGDALTTEHVRALAEILRAPAENESALSWGELAPQLYAAFEAQALSELGAAGH